MAPDAEKKISHRIREAERTEVSWNRDAVWMRVQEESFTQTSNRKYWYYAAAAVLLLIATRYVFLDLSDSKPQETVVNAPTTAPAHQTDKNLEQAVSEDVPRSQYTDALTEVKRVETKTNGNSIENENQALLPEEVEEIVADVEIADIIVEIPEELPEPHADVKTVEKIRPVVGVIVQQSGNHAAEVSKKRRRLHKLAPVDPLPWEEDPKKGLIFARRK